MKSKTGDVKVFVAVFPVAETEFGFEFAVEAEVTNPDELHPTGSTGGVTPSKCSMNGNEAICASADTERLAHTTASLTIDVLIVSKWASPNESKKSLSIFQVPNDET